VKGEITMAQKKLDKENEYNMLNKDLHPEDATRKEEIDRMRGIRLREDPERGPSNRK
jgi:hypothetical protein